METPPEPAKTSGLAITSLVLGISSVCLCCCGFAGIPAVILGHVARGRVKKSGGLLKGGGLALAGLITGYFSIAVMASYYLFVAPKIPEFSRKMQPALTVLQVSAAETKTGLRPADAGITSAGEFVKALVEKGGMTSEQTELLKMDGVLVGNVSAGDPGNTIVACLKTDGSPKELKFAMLKNGEIAYAVGDSEFKGVPPPRDPPYLAP